MRRQFKLGWAERKSNGKLNERAWMEQEERCFLSGSAHLRCGDWRADAIHLEFWAIHILGFESAFFRIQL